jgi:hypothetical protein
MEDNSQHITNYIENNYRHLFIDYTKDIFNHCDINLIYSEYSEKASFLDYLAIRFYVGTTDGLVLVDYDPKDYFKFFKKCTDTVESFMKTFPFDPIRLRVVSQNNLRGKQNISPPFIARVDIISDEKYELEIEYTISYGHL